MVSVYRAPWATTLCFAGRDSISPTLLGPSISYGMACRLCQWMIEEQRRQSHDLLARDREFWDGIKPGTLTMHIVSFHVFEGDLPRLRKDLRASSNS
jgi:hypothetical protein